MTVTDNPSRNGVDTATLFATLDAVRATPEIAKFQFRATNRWVSGTHNRSTLHGFYGAMQEMEHQRARSPSTPTTRPSSSAPTTARRRSSTCSTRWPPASPPASPTSPPRAASTSTRSSRPSRATSTCSASSGLSDDVRNGYEQIRVSFRLRGDDPEKLRRRRRAVPPALGRLRRADQRRARRHRRSTPADPSAPARPAPTPSGRGRSHAPETDRATMPTTHTLVIGAGQAGLAISRCLTDAGLDHVVLERGRDGRALAQRALGLPAPAHAPTG